MFGVYWVQKIGRYGMMSNMEMGWQIEEFMIYCKSKQLRAKTMASYEQALRLFERWCMNTMQLHLVTEITEPVIRHYITDLQERGKYSYYADESKKEYNCPERRRDYRQPISTGTINNYLRNLRVFFNWLEEAYVLKKNPMKRVRLLKDKRKAREYLSDDEFRKLVGRMDRSYYPEHRDYVMIVLMFDTGMRLGECTCLLLKDIDLTARKILLRAENTKGKQDRVVYFSSKTETILRICA